MKGFPDARKPCLAELSRLQGASYTDEDTSMQMDVGDWGWYASEAVGRVRMS
jgi:hypothetical protein